MNNGKVLNKENFLRSGIALLVHLQESAFLNTSCKNVNKSRQGPSFFSKTMGNNLVTSNLQLLVISDFFQFPQFSFVRIKIVFLRLIKLPCCVYTMYLCQGLKS